MATPIFTPAACVMFVGSDPAIRDLCAKGLPGLHLLRVGHAAAAVERMLVTRPLAIVVDESLHMTDLERVVECARDIRAEVVHSSKRAGSELVTAVQSAVLAAERNRESSSA